MIYKIKLYREVNHTIRYYSLRLFRTLFDGYILQKEFGSIHNLKPTGILQEHYIDTHAAFNSMKKLIASKAKKGYRICKTK